MRLSSIITSDPHRMRTQSFFMIISQSIFKSIFRGKKSKRFFLYIAKIWIKISQTSLSPFIVPSVKKISILYPPANGYLSIKTPFSIDWSVIKTCWTSIQSVPRRTALSSRRWAYICRKSSVSHLEQKMCCEHISIPFLWALVH